MKFKVYVQSQLAEESGIYSPEMILMDGNGRIYKVWTSKYKFKDDTCKLTLLIDDVPLTTNTINTVDKDKDQNNEN